MTTMAPSRARDLLVYGLCGAVLLLGGARAWGAGNCGGCVGTLRQVTHLTQGNIWKPGVSSQLADYVTIVSDGDVEGPGTAPGHREVFLYDVQATSFSRLTVTIGGESYDATRLGDDGERGRYLAFISTGNFDPSVGNADGNPELFFWRSETNEILQITDSQPPVVNALPFISDSGKCVTFQSNGDLHTNNNFDPNKPDSGFTNPDGSVEAFIYEIDADTDLQVGTFTQMSNGPAGTTSAHSAVGGYIFPRQCGNATFHSDHDQLGEGAIGTNVYAFSRATGTLQHAMPLNHPGGLTLNPDMTAASRVARGPFAVFQSNADILGNGSGGNFHIYRWRALHPNFTQYTWAPTGDSTNPTMSDGGGYIMFESTSELLDPVKSPGGPYNADGNAEIFFMRGRNRIQQVTQTAGCTNGDVSIHGYLGRSIAFRSTCNLVGQNPGGLPQLFIYEDVDRLETATLAACTPANGCCKESTCYTRIAGRTRKVPRPRRSSLPF
jgi:hypothetical protein